MKKKSRLFGDKRANSGTSRSADRGSRNSVKYPTLDLAYRRLAVLELAESLGNVSEACRRSGMDRTSFYVYKKRFEKYGLEGLKDLPPIHKSHPQTTPLDVVERVLALSLSQPLWGCTKLSDHLKFEGINISSPTVQKILIEHDMGSRHDRLLKLEECAIYQQMELTDEQVQLIETLNPCFRERHTESSRPGELLIHGSHIVTELKRYGQVKVHVLVDTYGSYAFGRLDNGKSLAEAYVVLRNEVLPFYLDHALPVNTVLVNEDGWKLCWDATGAFDIHRIQRHTGHYEPSDRPMHINGFVERFIRTAEEEFFRKALTSKDYRSVVGLQADFDQWFHYYNTERPHRGYRNMGRCPIDIILSFSRQTAADARA